MKIFVINLNSAKDRLKNVDDQLSKMNITYERISAINGANLDCEEVKNITFDYKNFNARVRYTRELTFNEVGCFLSHRACWQRLLESNDKYAVIMEDDITISNKAKVYLSGTNWIPSDVDVCQFSCLKKSLKGRVLESQIPLDDGVRLVSPIFPSPLGTQCYLISRRYAKAALELSNKFPAPVDDFLFSPWFDMAKKFTIWRFSPTLVIPNENFESNIESRDKIHVKKAPFWIRHGLTRFLLDRKIKKIQAEGMDYEFKYIE